MENKKKGKLFGVGVGPGDPELLTLKAVRVLKECEVLAIPAETKETCTAYGIIKDTIEQIENKECLYLQFPMTKDKEILEQSHNNIAKQVMDKLKTGMDVAFITLGDTTIYSTFMYLYHKIKEYGYDTEIVNGIPSFCAIAAKLGISLGEAEEEIHIIPATYGLIHACKYEGTKIFMKAGRKLEEIKEVSKETKCYLASVENCGMENEKIAIGIENVETTAGYYTTVIMK